MWEKEHNNIIDKVHRKVVKSVLWVSNISRMEENSILLAFEEGVQEKWEHQRETIAFPHSHQLISE